MASVPSPPSGSQPLPSGPHIKIERSVGQALHCKIGPKTYKLTDLQILRAGSSRWENLDIDNPDEELIKALGSLVQRVEEIVTHVGLENFNLNGAKEFSVISTQKTYRKDGKSLPFSIYKFVWLPSGATKPSEFKIELEDFEEPRQARIKQSATGFGEALHKAVQGAKIKPQPHSAKGEKTKSVHDAPDFITKIPGDGSCMLGSIAAQLSNLPQEKKDALAAKGISQDDLDQFQGELTAWHKAVANKDRGASIAAEQTIFDSPVILTLRRLAAEEIRDNNIFHTPIYMRKIETALETAKDAILLISKDLDDNNPQKQKLDLQIQTIDSILDNINDADSQIKALKPPSEDRANQILNAVALLVANGYSTYVSTKGIFLDRPSLDALSIFLELPIVVLSKDFRGDPNDIIVRSVNKSPQEFRGIESPETIFIYYNGIEGHKDVGGKHYEHVNPEHLEVRQIVQKNKEKLVDELGQELAKCDGALASDGNLNILKNCLSSLRFSFPNMVKEINAFLCGPNLLGGDVSHDDDEMIARRLLAAKNLPALFDFTDIENLAKLPPAP